MKNKPIIRANKGVGIGEVHSGCTNSVFTDVR